MFSSTAAAAVGFACLALLSAQVNAFPKSFGNKRLPRKPGDKFGLMAGIDNYAAGHSDVCKITHDVPAAGFTAGKVYTFKITTSNAKGLGMVWQEIGTSNNDDTGRERVTEQEVAWTAPEPKAISDNGNGDRDSYGFRMYFAHAICGAGKGFGVHVAASVAVKPHHTLEMIKALFDKESCEMVIKDERGSNLALCKKLVVDIGSVGKVAIAKMDKATLTKMIAATQKDYEKEECKTKDLTRPGRFIKCKWLEAELAQGNLCASEAGCASMSVAKPDVATPTGGAGATSTAAPGAGAASTAASGTDAAAVPGSNSTAAGGAGAASTTAPGATGDASTVAKAASTTAPGAPGDASTVAKAAAAAAAKAYTAAGCDADAAKDGCAELKKAKAAADAEVADLAGGSTASSLAASIAAVLVGAVAAMSF